MDSEYPGASDRQFDRDDRSASNLLRNSKALLGLRSALDLPVAHLSEEYNNHTSPRTPSSRVPIIGGKNRVENPNFSRFSYSSDGSGGLPTHAATTKCVDVRESTYSNLSLPNTPASALGNRSITLPGQNSSVLSLTSSTNSITENTRQKRISLRLGLGFPKQSSFVDSKVGFVCTRPDQAVRFTRETDTRTHLSVDESLTHIKGKTIVNKRKRFSQVFHLFSH